MKLVLIPPGEFQMGSSKELIEEELRLNHGDGNYRGHLLGEGPRHRVRITKPYWLGATDVTQEEYEHVVGVNPSKFRDPKRPVEHVSSGEAVEFCRKLSELPGEKASRRRYALPTDAQWEYACRAGSTGRWCFSSQPSPFPVAVEEKLLGEYAWFSANSGGSTHQVGQKRANVWGLYDMYGNVWQWCQDCYDKDYYSKSPVDDPQGAVTGDSRVIRGGAWNNDTCSCRSAVRYQCVPGTRHDQLGFRVSRVLADRLAKEPTTGVP